MRNVKLGEMKGVREYAESYPVELWRVGDRIVIRAFNESRCNSTMVDALDLIKWIARHPDMITTPAKPHR